MAEKLIQAVWKDTVIAESDNTVIIEGNHYFPPDSVNSVYLSESSTHSQCSWKGQASYYDIVVGDDMNRDAAWYYPYPQPAAVQIKDYIAFWHGVEIREQAG